MRKGISKSCGCLYPGHNRLPKGKSAFNVLYKRYQLQAKSRNRDFKLTKKQFQKLTSKPCFYCGQLPIQKSTNPTWNGDYNYNGIDRLDNKKGYTIKNCVPCCKICNIMKGILSFEKFIYQIKKIAKRRLNANP